MTKKEFEVVACILSYTEIKNKNEITTLLKSTNKKFNEKLFWHRVWEYQNGRI